MTTKSALHEQDFYAWSQQQVALLRSGHLAQADIENIAREIETMGNSEKRELVNRLAVLLVHLLKWKFQPALRGNSWRLTIEEQRDQLEDHLHDNPSLKSRLDESIITAYRRALLGAARETGMDREVFPAACPWQFAQLLDDGFWPD